MDVKMSSEDKWVEKFMNLYGKVEEIGAGKEIPERGPQR